MAAVHSSGRRRLQFSMLSLLLLMTATCLALGWWARPRPVEVTALMHAPSLTSRAFGSRGMPPFDFQQHLVTMLHSDQLMTDAVSVVGNGKLRMFRGQHEPAAWLRERLEIEVLPGDVVSIKLRAPAQFAKEAIEVVDYLTLRTATRVNVAAAKATNTSRSVNSLSGELPRILQTAMVTSGR